MIFYTLNLKNKTMKISFTLLAILVVLSVVIPFLIFVFKGLNSTSKTKQKAENLIKSSNYKYEKTEVWNNKFIGITKDKTVFTYIHFKDENTIYKNINVSEIQSCESISNYKTDRDKVIRLKNLDLKISFKSNNKEPLLLCFYDTNEGFIEDYESRRIENWESIVKTELNKREAIKKAS